jgi:hypothetical protein
LGHFDGQDVPDDVVVDDFVIVGDVVPGGFRGSQLKFGMRCCERAVYLVYTFHPLPNVYEDSFDRKPYEFIIVVCAPASAGNPLRDERLFQ